MSAADICGFCGTSGEEKGIDNYSHTHCRMCHDHQDNAYKTKKSAFRIGGAVSRSSPAVGDIWTVSCNGQATEVKALCNRDRPAKFRPPLEAFRSSVRMITVVVGKDADAETFLVPEPLLRHASPFFENALKTTFFSEGSSCKFEFDDRDPQIFGLLNEFIHLGSIRQQERKYITYTLAELQVGLDENAPSISWEYPTMIDYAHLWLLAHYLQITPLLDYSVWRLINMADDHKYSICISDMEDLYTRAPVGSQLRKLLIHLCVWRDKNEDIEPTEDAPPSMMRELIRELKRSRGDRNQVSPLMDVRSYYEEWEATPPPPPPPPPPAPATDEVFLNTSSEQEVGDEGTL